MDYRESAIGKINEVLDSVRSESVDAMAPAKPVQATVSNVTADGVYVKTDGDDTAKGPFPATIMPKLNDRVALTNLGGTWTVTDDFDDPGASGTWVNTETGKITQRVDEIRAGVGKFDELYATTATFSVLVAENATLEQLQAAQVYAESVNAQLVAAPVAQFGEICAESATVQDITANVARIDTAELKQLNADVATFGVIGAKYAQVDAANIDTATMREAWVDNLMVQTGLISHSGTIYELDAIQVNASKIKAGTLDVERLIVTVGGEKYLVHVDAQGTAAYQKLDGNIVEDLTITTDKLVAGAVTAQKITTENIVGTGGWINLHSGTFAYVSAATGEGIAWDGSHLVISGNVTIGDVSAELLESAARELTYGHDFTKTDDTYEFTAWARRGGEDVTDLFDPYMFVWFLRTESGDSFWSRGVTATFTEADIGYRATVVGGLEEVLVAVLADSDGNGIVMSDNSEVAINAIWEV